MPAAGPPLLLHSPGLGTSLTMISGDKKKGNMFKPWLCPFLVANL
jgi:hypothetical protein